MLTLSAFLSLNFLYFMLRVSPSGGSFPKPLSQAEEAKTIALLMEGDKAARDKLIEHNLRLVAHIVKKYYAAREDQDDLISVGTIGLIKAISSFNSEKKIKLATYAAKCIENEILMYFRTLKKQSLEVSLSEPIDSDGSGNTLSLIDVISCEDEMLEDIDYSDRLLKLKRCVISELEGRERDILIMRYGIFGHAPLTQREIASKCGISRSYVSRIEKKALQRLRHCLDED